MTIAEYFENGNIKFSDNLALNILLIILIQYFWSRLNDLSFITINTMISMTVPGIVQIISYVIYNLIFMDILQTEEWLLPESMRGDDDGALNSFFYESGFSSKKLMPNLGSTLVYIMIYLGAWLFILIFWLFKEQELEKMLYEFLLSRMKWNWSFLFLNSQFCPLVTSSIISFYDFKTSNIPEFIYQVFAITIFSILLFSLLF